MFAIVPLAACDEFEDSFVGARVGAMYEAAEPRYCAAAEIQGTIKGPMSASWAFQEEKGEIHGPAPAMFVSW